MLIPKSCLSLECRADRWPLGSPYLSGPGPQLGDTAAGLLGRDGREPGL